MTSTGRICLFGNVDDGESSDCDSDGFEFHHPLLDSLSNVIPGSLNNVGASSSAANKESPSVSWKGENVSLSDVYIDFSKSASRMSLQKNNDAVIDSIMKKSAIGPDFEKLESVPPYHISRRRLLKEKQKKRESSKGKNWFNMPAVEMTEEIKNDLEILQMRSVLDPKQFYKKNTLTNAPKYFHVGTIVESSADFYSSRIPKKQRKSTMVDELLADANFQRYNKLRYKEITEERKKTTYKSYKLANRLKKKGQTRKY